MKIGIIYWKEIRVVRAEWDVGPDDMWGTRKVKFIVPFELHSQSKLIETSTEVEKRVRNAFFERAIKLKWPISGAWQSWFVNELKNGRTALAIIIDTSSMSVVDFFKEMWNNQKR